MAENKPQVIIFGAGMTGRGHIAQLAFDSNWQIIFVDKNAELVKLLNDKKEYTVHLISNSPYDITISDYQAIHTDNRLLIQEAIAKADMIITSVLPNNLADVAPLIADGLKLRLLQNSNPLNIISAENMNDGSSILWSFVSKYLTEHERQGYRKSFGFPNSMIARVVPRSFDPLYIIAEDYNEWTADKLNCVGDPPSLNGLEWVPNQEARLKRKLYIHNAGHAVCAYLGAIKGYKFIHESARDEWVISWVKKSIAESGTAVCKEFGFDNDEIKKYTQSLIDRLPKDALPDGIERVVREPIRKLGLNDRLLGPLLLCEKYGLPKEGLCLGIASVMASEINDREGFQLKDLIDKNGVIKALSAVSSYNPDEETSRRIEMYYNSLISLAFASISVPKYDVMGLGIVAVDDLFMIDNYPPPDTKLRASGVMRQGGGLTGTALVASSRLGARCAYAGILGKDELSNWTVTELEKEGIDCSLTIRSADVKPYHAIIIVDTTNHTRNIIFSDKGVMPRPVDTIDEILISQAKVLLIDQLGIDSMLKATIIAKKLGIPTIADIEREDHPKTRELLSQIDHLILSTNFAGKLTGTDDPTKQVKMLHNRRLCTAVTVGIKGCWFMKQNQPDIVFHQPAFKVRTVDTTGCGDVFHGAYASGIAWNWSVDDCIKFASATSALKATKPGGRAGIPDKLTVENFLKSNPETYK